MSSTRDRSHALFPGTFDPVTLGHLDVLKRASRIFERITVAVAVHESKRQLLEVDERLELLRRSIVGLSGVTIARFDGLVVHGCEAFGASVILRGLRTGGDFDYEMRMAHTNRSLAPEIDTVLLACSPGFAHISSTLVRQVARMGGDLEGFVPPPVAELLRQRFGPSEETP